MRRILSLDGEDALPFLQGLVTNDVLGLKEEKGIRYAALLTPQGKYLADFFVVNSGEGLLLDLPSLLADDILARLMRYRLRAKVSFGDSGLALQRGIGPAPDGAFADPRHPALGWRLYRPAAGPAPEPQDIDWDQIRVHHVIPETGIELIPDDSYILEHGFERLSGVDFRKGCYVGQEVTARMKHKTTLKKGLVAVRLGPGPALPPGTRIEQDGREAGQLFTQSGDLALAHLRLDRAEGLTAAGRPVLPHFGQTTDGPGAKA